MSKKQKLEKQAMKAYIKMREKMPDATPEQLEQAARKYLINKKMARVGIYFGIALIAYLLRNHGMALFQNFAPDTIKIIEVNILGGIESLCLVIGVLSFSASLHEPLTPAQIKEFEEREHLEKTGKPFSKE